MQMSNLPRGSFKESGFSKGWNKLKWYCQACRKQCNDENSYQLHIDTSLHHTQCLLFVQAPPKYLEKFSKDFSEAFVEVLHRKFGTKRVLANLVYREYINENKNLHINGTKWLTFPDFVKSLANNGICHVDGNKEELFISWTDRGPGQLIKQKKIELKTKTRKREEEFMKKLAQPHKSNGNEKPQPEYTALCRDKEDKKLSFKMSLKSSKSSRSNTLYSKNVFSTKGRHHFPTLDSKSSYFAYGGGLEGTFKANIKETVIKEEDESEESWLKKGIVVKVVTRKLGKYYYGKKGVVIDNVSKYIGIIKLIECSTLLKIDQVDLQTVLPTLGMELMVVKGEYVGFTGVMVGIELDDFSVYVKLIKREGQQNPPCAPSETIKLEYEYVSKIYSP